MIKHNSKHLIRKISISEKKNSVAHEPVHNSELHPLDMPHPLHVVVSADSFLPGVTAGIVRCRGGSIGEESTTPSFSFPEGGAHIPISLPLHVGLALYAGDLFRGGKWRRRRIIRRNRVLE